MSNEFVMMEAYIKIKSVIKTAYILEGVKQTIYEYLPIFKG